jgi:hypothetical protein
MSTGSSPFGYSFFDFLTRIIPGLVVVTPVLVGYVILVPSVDTGYQPVMIGLAVVGLIIGELIDFSRSPLFRVPLPFKQIIYHHTDNKNVLSRLDRWSLWLQAKVPDSWKPNFITEEIARMTIFDASSKDFQEEYESHFGLKFEEAHSHLLYSALLSYMDTKMSTDTRRYYTLRIFAQNLMVAAVLTLLSSLVMILLIDDTQLVLIFALSIMLLLVLFVLGIIFSSVAIQFVNRLIVDYYVDRLE